MMRAMRAVAILALLLVVEQVKAGPITFDFQFDNQGDNGNDGSIIPPIVGNGTFTIANDPGPGTFTLASLGTFSLSMTFTDGNTFTQADITSDPTKSEVVIVPVASGERLYFSDTGSGGGGFPNGALDLFTGTAILSFEPTYVGGHNLYVEGLLANPGPTFVGNYLGLTPGAIIAPEPSSLTLLGIGAFGLFGYGWRRRKLAAA